MRLVINPVRLCVNDGSVLSDPMNRRRDVRQVFKEVRSKISDMDGGAGELQSAADQLTQRQIKSEIAAEERIKTAGERLGMFLQNARTVDKKVAALVAVNQVQFFIQHPDLIPPPPPKGKSAWQRFKDGCKKLGKAIVGGFKKAANWVAETAKKVWKATVDFCKKHWKAIVKVVVGVVVIAGLAALSVVTGGAAAPLLAVAAKGAAIAACTGAAVSVVSGVAKGQSFDEIFDNAGNSFLVGSITGAVGGFAGAAAGSVASATGSQLLGELTKVGIETAGKMLAEGASFLIDKGTLSGFMDAKGFDILKDGGMSMLSSAGSAAFGYFKDTGKKLLGDAFGGLKDSQLLNSFKNTYEWCENAAPTLTRIVSDSVTDTFGNMSWSDLAKLKNPSEFAKGIGNSLLGNLGNNLAGPAADFVRNDLNNFTGSAVDKVTDFVGDIAGNITNSDFGKAIGGTYNDINGFVSDVKGEIGGAYDQMKNQLGGAYDQMKDQLGGAYDQAKGVYDTAYGHVNQMVGEFKIDLGNAFGSVVGDISSTIGSAAGNIRGTAADISRLGSSAVQGFSNEVGGAVGGFRDNISGAIGKVQGQVGSAFGELRGQAGSLGGGLSRDIAHISGSIAKGTSYLGGEIRGVEGRLGNILNSATTTVSTTLPALSKVGSGNLGNILCSISSTSSHRTSNTLIRNTNNALGLLSRVRL